MTPDEVPGRRSEACPPLGSSGPGGALDKRRLSAARHRAKGRGAFTAALAIAAVATGQPASDGPSSSFRRSRRRFPSEYPPWLATKAHRRKAKEDERAQDPRE